MVAPTSVHRGQGQHRPQWLLVAILAFVVGGISVALLYQLDVLGGSSGPRAAGEGSGVAATQVRSVDAFSSLDLDGGNNVVIHIGAAQSVVVKGDDNLLARVTTEVQSGKLVIGNTPGRMSSKTPMSVEVSVPSLDTLTLSGSGNIIVSGVDAESFTVSLPGSGTLTASGTTSRLDVTVDGSGTVQFSRLVAADVKATIEGSGSIFVSATKSLDALVSGTGSILYAGNPQQVTKSVTGTGSIVASR